MSMVAAEAAAGRSAAAGATARPAAGGGVPAGTRYRARQETAAESRTLNREPRTAPRETQRETPRPQRSSQGRTAPRRSGLRTAQGIGRAAVSSPEFHNYQGIILAEFVAAELLVSATPIATRQHKEGLSPYIPRDMTKLLSIGLVYFVLELLAVGGGKAGRFGAWFGGLILLAVGLNEGASIAKTLDLFGGSSTSTSSTSSTSTSGA